MKEINTEFKSIAKRYSKALSELCGNDSVKKEEVLKDLSNIVEILEQSNDLSNLMKTPSVSKTEKQNIIKKVFEGKISKETNNFLLYTIEKDRFNILPSVYEEFKSEMDKENNFVNIEIVSAIELNKDTQNNIEKKLSDKLNKKLNISWSVNSDIIAGLVFVVGDSIIDTGVKSKLDMIGRNIIK